MDEAQALADRVAVMRGGRDHRLGPARRDRRPRPAPGRDPLRASAGRSLGDVPERADGRRRRRRPTACSSTRASRCAPPTIVTTWALDRDVELGHFSVTQPTLEDIYLELTGARRAQIAEVQEASMSAVPQLDAPPRPGPDGMADPLRAARLLAQPRARHLHVRVPDHVPGDLRLAGQGPDDLHPRAASPTTTSSSRASWPTA